MHRGFENSLTYKNLCREYIGLCQIVKRRVDVTDGRYKVHTCFQSCTKTNLGLSFPSSRTNAWWAFISEIRFLFQKMYA